MVSGAALVALREELERMLAMTRADEVPLDELGKSLGAIARAIHGVFVASKTPSMRIDAAVKALDLRTKRSELESFVSVRG